MALRILFVHPLQAECDSFRRMLLDEDLIVDTVNDLASARTLCRDNNYEMVFVNRRFENDDVLKFIDQVSEKFPDAEIVMGIQAINKVEFIHYKNENRKYRIYLEPVNYRAELLPFIENTMGNARIRLLNKSDKEASEKEKSWKEYQNLLLSLLNVKKESRTGFAEQVLSKYHIISMSSIKTVSDLKNEIHELFITNSELSLNWQIRDNAIRILEYADAEDKMFISRVMVMAAIMEAVSLSDGYKVNSSVMLEGHRRGLHLSVQSMITAKPGDEGSNSTFSLRNERIMNEADGLFCVNGEENTRRDDFPAGMWMHTRDVIYTA